MGKSGVENSEPFPFFSEINMTAQILDGNALGQKLRAGFKQKADERNGRDNRSGAEVFASLRAWKDKF